jgi:hypothetical protein
VISCRIVKGLTSIYIGKHYEYMIQMSRITPVDVSPLNYGVACQDDATGSGYLLYSAESVHTRFAANPPHADNADHFICVKYMGGQWMYDNNTAYYAFTPEEGDILMASINFDTDVITSLAGYNSTYGGIAKGYASGNLVYTPDQFGGGYNDGEFTVSGTSFTPNKLVIARKYYSAEGSRVAMRYTGQYQVASQVVITSNLLTLWVLFYALLRLILPSSISPALYTCLNTTFPSFISDAVSHTPMIFLFPSNHPTCTTRSTAWAKISLAASMRTWASVNMITDMR